MASKRKFTLPPSLLAALLFGAFSSHAHAQGEAAGDSVSSKVNETVAQRPQVLPYDYALWLAASYAVMPIMFVASVARDDIDLTYASLGGILVPPLTHLVNGQPGLAGRSILCSLGLTLGSGLVLGLVGYGLGSALDEDHPYREGDEEDSRILPVLGAAAGAYLGAAGGWILWAVIDVTDVHEHASGAKSPRTASLSLAFAPTPGGAIGALSGTF